MKPEGLPATARLLHEREFKAVFSARQKQSNRHFRIHWSKSDQSRAEPRLGLAIAKRVARRAVDRNRIRRLVRETFRIRRLKLRPLDYVVLANPAALEADNPTLIRSLDQLWQRFEI